MPFDNQAALAVVLPDAFLQRVVDQLGYALRNNGFVLRFAKPLALDANRIDILYRGLRSKTRAVGRVHGAELTHSLVELDSAAVVVLKRIGGGAGDASLVLHDLKGASSPEDRSGMHLRSVSTVADRCLSVLHTPDDLGQAAEDLALLLDPDQQARAIDALEGGVEIPWQLLSATRSYEAPSSREPRHAALLRAALRAFSLAALEKPDHTEITLQASLAARFQGFVADFDANDHAPADEFCRFVKAAEEMEGAILGTSRLTSHGSPLAELAIDILRIRRSDLALAKRTVTEIRAAGSSLDGYEKQLLLTRAAFAMPD